MTVKVKYTGSDPVLLMHKDGVWLVEPGDEPFDLPFVPDHPHFVEVKDMAVSKGKEKGVNANGRETD